MNKTLRIFLCALLATSPIVAMQSNEQPKDKQRNLELQVAIGYGAVAGISFWQMLEHCKPLCVYPSNIDVISFHKTLLLTWMTLCGLSTVAAIILSDSCWNTTDTNSTNNQETNNELPAPCYYE